MISCLEVSELHVLYFKTSAWGKWPRGTRYSDILQVLVRVTGVVLLGSLTFFEWPVASFRPSCW